MKRKLFKSFIVLLVIFSMLSGFGGIAGAFEPYRGYGYNSWGLSEPSPNSYTVGKVINSTVLGLEKPFDKPTDIFYRNGKLFVLDPNNSRIVVLDKELTKVIKIIDRFTLPEGMVNDQPNITLPEDDSETPDPRRTWLINSLGIYVTENEEIIIADTEGAGKIEVGGEENVVSGRVLITDMDGNVKKIILAPTATNKGGSTVFPEKMAFKPKKVLKDKLDNIYVLCEGFYYGAVRYNAKGEYDGFFGANPVEVTLELLASRLWRLFLTDVEKSYEAQFSPVEYSSFDIDDEDFIYTVSDKITSSVDEVKKLNGQGTNILMQGRTLDSNLDKSDFGDRERLWYRGKPLDNSLSDICVTDNMIITVLDTFYGKIFQYDQYSNLLSVTSGMSNQKGMSNSPTSIEAIEDRLVLLDLEKNSITEFIPTEYGKLLIEASGMYNEGLYQEALPLWQDVLKFNSNSEIAYKGIANALLQQGKYKESLKYFKLGYDRMGYSKAYMNYRTQVIRENFTIVILTLIAFILFMLYKKKIFRRIKILMGKDPDKTPIYNPFYTMAHPVSGIEELKNSNSKTPILVSLGIIAFWFATSIIQRQAYGFIFNYNRTEALDIKFIIGKTVGLILLFCISNWAVGSLIDGEGSFRKIFITSSYSLFPMIITILIASIVSNFATYEEGQILTWLILIGTFYTYFMLFQSTRISHQYEGVKTLAGPALTIAFMAVIVFIGVLAYTLIQQLYIFVFTIINEILFRI